MPSLKEIQSKVGQEKIVTTSFNDENQTSEIKFEKKLYNKANLEDAIRNFIDHKKEEGKIVESVAFSEASLIFSEQVITFQVTTEIEKQHIEKNRGNLINYLRNCFDIALILNIEVIETKDEKRLIYSSSDKYNFLVENFPILEKLKRTLGLEVEY